MGFQVLQAGEVVSEHDNFEVAQQAAMALSESGVRRVEIHIEAGTAHKLPGPVGVTPVKKARGG